MSAAEPARPVNTNRQATVLRTVGLVAPVAVTLLVAVALGPVLRAIPTAGLRGVIGLVVTVGVAVGSGVLAYRVTRSRLRSVIDTAAERRRAAAPAARAAGWTWAVAAPAPAPELCEAVLRRRRRSIIWPIGMSEVATGITPRGRRFFAGHLVGYAVAQDRGGSHGVRQDENVVAVELPGLLPELRIVDRRAGAWADLGAALPALPAVPGLSARWELQGFAAPFARELLAPAVLAVLETAPEDCTIVVRIGTILCCRDLVADAAAVAARLDLLDRLVDAVPSGCWGRADALTAGAGVFPARVDGVLPRPVDTTRATQADRLAAPNWSGEGFATIPWQQAPDAPLAMSTSSTQDSTTTVLLSDPPQWSQEPGSRPGPRS